MSFRRILLFLALTAAGSDAARAAGATISGTVTDSGSGGPLPGMTVAAYTLSGFLQATAATDAEGRYQLSIPAAAYRLLGYDLAGVYATTFYPNAESFDTSPAIAVAASQVLTSINFALQKGGRLAGRVTAAQSGSPLAGMTVAAYNLDGTQRGRTSTSSTGSYSMVVPPGQYKMTTYDETLAYASQFYSGQMSFGAASTLSVLGQQTVSGVDFVLLSAARFSGTVLDRGSLAGLPGITVGAYDLNGILISLGASDASGRFAMALLPGSYKFVASDSSGFYLTSYYRDAPDFASAASFSLVAGQNLPGIEFDLASAPNSTTTRLFVAAAAHVTGANGTFFQTDVWIFNRSASAALSVFVTYLPAGQDNSSRAGVSVSVPPRQQVRQADIVAGLFGATGVGALKFEAPGPFTVTTRTYNNPANAALVGTNGFSVAGEPIGHSLARGVVTGLSRNAAYRSNVGVMNPQPYPVTVRFELFDASGVLLARGSRALQPLDQFQANTIFDFLGLAGSFDNAYCVISSQDGSFFAYGVIADQISGDPTYVGFVGD